MILRPNWEWRTIAPVAILFSLLQTGPLQGATITSIATGNWSGSGTSAWPNTNRTNNVTSFSTSTAVTGSGTLFTTELTVGNVIATQSGTAIGTVATITDNTHLTLTANASNTVSNQPYRSNGVGPADSVTIASGHTVTMDVTSATVTALTMASPTAANNLSISTGKMLTVINAITFTANAAANAQTITLNGTANLNAGSIVTSASTSTGASVITCASGANGTLTVNGAITLAGSSINSSNGAKIDFGTTSTTCNVVAGSVSLVGGTKSAALLKLGTGNLTLTGTLSGSGTAANAQLTTSGAASITLNNGVIATGETLSIAAGTDLTTIAASTITYATAVATWGDLNVQSGTFFYTAGGGTFSSITINSSAIFSHAVAITDSGDYSNDGTETGAGALTLTGSGSQIDVTGATTMAGLTTMTNNKTILSTTTLTLTGALTISAASIITQNGVLNVGGTLTVTGTMNNNGVVTASGTLTGVGSWTQGSGSTLIANGGTTNAMAVTTTNFSTNPNTVKYNLGSAQTCKATQYYNLEINGAGTKTCAATSPALGDVTVGGTAAWTMGAALTVNGDLTIAGGTLTTGAFAFQVNGNTEVSAGTLSLASTTGSKTLVGLVTVDGGTLNGVSTGIIFQGGITQTAGSVAITGTASFNTNNQDLNGTISIANVNVAGPVTLTNNDTLICSGAVAVTGGVVNDGAVTVGGNLTGAGSWTQNANSMLTANGGTTNAMAVTTVDFTTSSNTVVYGASVAQTANATSYYNLVLAGTSAKTLTGVTSIDGNFYMSGSVTATSAFTSVNGDITITGTAALTLGAADLVLGGNLNIPAGTLTTGNSMLTVAGVTTIGGTWTHSGSGNVFLQSDVIVNGTMSGAGTGPIAANGDVTGTGTINLTGTNQTFEQRVSANHNFGQLSGSNNWSFKNLMFSNSSASPVLITMETGGTGGITVGTTLILGRSTDTANTLLDPGDAVWTLSGTGTVFSMPGGNGDLCDPGTCPTNTSTFKYTGATATTIGGSSGYYDVLSTPTITAAVAYSANGPMTVAHNFTMNPTAGSSNRLLTLTLSGNLTVGNTLRLQGTVSACSAINTSGTAYNVTANALTIATGPGSCTDNFIANSSTITLTGTGTPLSIGASFASFTYNTSTVRYTGNGATVSALSGSAGTNGYYNLQTQPGGASAQVLGTAASQPIQVNNDFTVGDGTNAGATAATNNPILNVLGDVNIANGATLTAAPSSAFNVGGSWNNSGAFASNSSTVTFNGSTAGNTILSNGSAFTNLVINAGTASGAWTMSDNMVVNSTLTLTKGNLSAGANDITLKGGWAETNGFVFTPNTGQVILTGTVSQKMNSIGESFNAIIDSNTSGGGVIFTSSLTANLFIINASALGSDATAYFVAGSSFVISNIRWLGDASNFVHLRSLTTNSTWTLNNTSTNTVTYTDVKDSDAHLGQTIAAGSRSINSGNNTNWTFLILGVSFFTHNYDFGTVSMGATTISTYAVVVTNLGNDTETYSLSVSTTTGTIWQVATSTPTTMNHFAMFGNFNTTQPTASGFVPGDIILETPTTASASVYAGDQTGVTVPSNAARNFWMRLDMPISTTSTANAGMQLTITATSP